VRTTLDIDDTVMAAAKAIARDRGVSLGTVISGLARDGLRSGRAVASAGGFPVFAVSETAAPITIDLVNEHRDE
jgi:orotidine-5'-phosphate decarboxylase